MAANKKYNAFIFDLDGTIYNGLTLIPGAVVTVNKLISINKKIVFVSNKTTDSANDYYKFLKLSGMNVHQDMFITATETITEYLKNNFKNEYFFAIGETKFISAVESAGINFSVDPEKIKVVIITLDRNVTFEKLEIAARALERGAKFFAANIDDTCPVEDGEITDAGSVISALQKRTKRNLEDHFGKPSAYMFQKVMQKLKSKPEETILIGDRLETDIAMANFNNIDSVLVNTGVKKTELNGKSFTSDYKINSVAELLPIIENYL